ncbi:choice-of-anchor M domain-containing protein [Psychromicrobium lacuslunae]|uniref:Surface-anchored protein n=1 Tax=Psychromicrobium lacuslunae TaxID=1618207 RepID=A0A0D4C0T8_9MICC|nr:choice-of-anchor M domain-containing protein [Psychromicrobium lacuslunae]AJT42164.1 hypothetical protein UM93_12810 [Psychromicrobium lacuslunae]
MKLISSVAASILAAAVLSTPLLPPSPTAPTVQNTPQTIAPDEPAVNGQAVISNGHVDIGPRFSQGPNENWAVQLHDDSGAKPVWRSLPDVVLQVSDQAKQAVPDDPSYRFLGIPAGQEVYVVPQTQQPGVVWVGWNTQDPRVIASIKRQARFSLVSAQGPGSVLMYLQSGDLSAPQILWNSTKAARQDIYMDANVHTHANWVFSKPGSYLLTVEFAAELSNGKTSVDRQVLRFAVGSGTNPQDVFNTAVQQPSQPAGSAADAATDQTGQGLIWLAAGGAAALAVLLIVVLLLRSLVKSRRAKLAVENSAIDSSSGGRS